ncbi:FHA domain-containing protein [Acinetobacter sp. MD2(2019)]|uniref:FHA domain-containing protein n=1 Tax=Acinetobacter sp. MD2(2019) TaxID=2605273 RepID=UPI002D1F5D27|nr:FHA domain-containing protein [Acinetobacter sp. MD2(2019)]MEB3754465.1 FHA domain-containing protein [Acinetobacter sp. MD2(2019)]
MNWKLHALANELTDQEISIDRSMTIGRHPDCDLVLQSAAISRQHAVFNLNEDGVWLKDAGSSNGTFVNDVRIDAETLLQDQDVIQFAHLKFLVLAPAVEEKPAEPVAAQMKDQGMPSLAERGDTLVNAEGMPQKMAIPVPAPLPEGVDIHAKAEPTPVSVEVEPSRVEQKIEEKKNASVGLLSIVVLIVLAVIAWLLLK